MNLSAALSEEDNEEQVTEILPAIASALSLMSVKPQFAQYVRRAEEMMNDAKKINITDEESLKFSVALGGEAKKITKVLDAKRKEVTAEASEFIKQVNGFVKIFTDKLSDTETEVKRKIVAYQAKVELQRRKQEELARQAAEKVQEQVNKEAKAAGVEAPTVPAPVIPEAPTITRTETGTTAYQIKTWKCYVQSPDLVPREYCVPDGRLLNQAVKQGIREIPGCSIVEENSTRFRT
jgi:hypothetical protein